MNKKSNYMFLLLFFIVLIIIVDIISRIYIVNSVKDDAATINELGVIRGSIQRIVKNEMEGIKKDDLIANVDHIFAQYFSESLANKKSESIEERKALEKEWGDLKDRIYDYRREQSEEDRQELFLLSEKIWIISNNVVSQAQLESEVKIKLYSGFIVSSIFSLIIIAAVIGFVKVYIKDRLEDFAIHDSLTKAYNRYFFDEILSKELQKASRNKGFFSLLMLDIDHFKQVNDQYGHEKGDEVLKEMALIVQRSLREYDIFVRFGGEEFIVVLPETPIADAAEAAQRIRLAVQNNGFKDIHQVTISLGVIQYKSGDTSDSIIKRVDDALYLAKKNGRNRVEVIG